MKTLATLIFVLLFNLSSNAQESLRHTVYFASDKAVIISAEQQKLDAFIAKLGDQPIASCVLSGHTDSDADDQYNLKLSQRRVDAVSKQLSGLSPFSYPIGTAYFGEAQPVDVNTNSAGKQNNRRVEIVIILEEPVVDSAPIVAKIPEKDCSYDTTLIFPQGTEVTMNVCDYFSIKDCFQFIEYNTGESIRNSNLTTTTADGTPLISGGMYEIKMCKDVEVTVYIPWSPSPCDSMAEFSLWTATSEGTWSPIKGAIDRVRRGGGQFLRTVVSKTTTINCDALPSVPPPKMIVKVPRGYKLLKAKVSADVPVSLIYAQKLTKRTATFNAICPCSELLIYLEVEKPNGELDTLNFTKLNEYDTHEAFGQCRTNEVIKRVLFFKVRKKAMYRKYLIRKKDFELKK